MLVPGRRRTYSRTQCDASSGNLLYICVRVADVTQALENISDPRNRTLSSDSHVPPIFFHSVISENFALLRRESNWQNTRPPRVWNNGSRTKKRVDEKKKSYRGCILCIRCKKTALQRLGLENREIESGQVRADLTSKRVLYVYSIVGVTKVSKLVIDEE